MKTKILNNKGEVLAIATFDVIPLDGAQIELTRKGDCVETVKVSSCLFQIDMDTQDTVLVINTRGASSDSQGGAF